ncbi:MAG: hypothetical protein LBE22_12050 [Azoarcus sp.]|jgi:hypothetical protein|nr:hypothetical protein [Azoarcus sp.]
MKLLSNHWSLLLLCLCLVANPCFAGAPTSSEKDEWRGWWFLYHRNEHGKLVLDKFTIAIVIDDVAFPEFGRSTGIWVGCMWMAESEVRVDKNGKELFFSDSFKMTRIGPDEAEVFYVDKPDVKYLARREREHGVCAGYSS